MKKYPKEKYSGEESKIIWEHIQSCLDANTIAALVRMLADKKRESEVDKLIENFMSQQKLPKITKDLVKAGLYYGRKEITKG